MLLREEAMSILSGWLSGSKWDQNRCIASTVVSHILQLAIYFPMNILAKMISACSVGFEIRIGMPVIYLNGRVQEELAKLLSVWTLRLQFHFSTVFLTVVFLDSMCRKSCQCSATICKSSIRLAYVPTWAQSSTSPTSRQNIRTWKYLGGRIQTRSPKHL